MWAGYMKHPGSRCTAWLMFLVLAPCAGVSAQQLHLADAVHLALIQNPDIKVQRTQVEAAFGQQQQAAGQFDWAVSSGLNYERTISPLTGSAVSGGAYGSVDRTRVFATGYQAALSKQLRNGLIVGAGFDASGTQDATRSPAAPQQNLARLNVSLTVPLLQGHGQAVTAVEDAAALTAQARRYDLLDSAAHALYNTLVAYWTYRARIELEKIAISSEERSRSLLESTQKLVDASEKPAADLVLLKADLADKVAAREAATLAHTEARQALGRLLGLDASAIAALPEPAEALPGGAAPPQAKLPSLAVLRAQALARRPDVRALALLLDAAQRNVEGARDLLKPRLDLNMGLAYAKASEGEGRYRLFSEPGRYQSAPSVFATLSFAFPIANNQAKGLVRERSAALSQVAIQQSDLATGVATGVDFALQSLMSSASQLDVGRSGLALYEQAVRQEITKQRNGISTLIDVINTEARYISARIGFLQAQLGYATAIARLRLETGTLVPVSDTSDRFSLDPDDLGGFGPLASQTFTPSPARTEDHEK
jgi:outer membrane protein TolC